ncbi:hypothetical protein M758_9G155800 [Ceratodon purpureus]|nr:hypothetical protein M758_9G155800 [Ceratodon purpureus]
MANLSSGSSSSRNTLRMDMAMEQAKEVTNFGETSKTSEGGTEYYTSIAEPTPRSAPAPARVYPTLLTEYQSKDIKEVKRTGLADIKYVKKGKGTVLGRGGQASIHEVVVDTGVEHGGVNARYQTYAMKKFNGLSIDSLHGQWQEQVHGLKDYYGGFICEFYGYCRDYEAYGSDSDEEEEEVPSDGFVSKAATWMKKLSFREKYESAEESSFKMGSFCLLMKKYDCSLRNVLDKVKLKPGVAINMMVQIAVGMKIVHQEGILHRDLKADNVFVYKSDEDNMPWGAYIGDFDVAESVEGTPFWRAPEILEGIAERNRLRMAKEYTLEQMQAIKGNIPWSPMADVYCYGMTCYEILTSGIPFEGRRKDHFDCVVKQGMRPELPANLNPAIRDLIHSCWHQDPQQRPTFDAILLEFKRILHELPRFLAMVDEVGNLPPAKNRPSTEECIARLEHIEEELRAKYPKEFFVERDELDFVELEMRWTRTMKKFVNFFGYKPYVDHPSLPWSLWFKRMKGLMKVNRLAVEVVHAFPFIKVNKAIGRLRLYITEAVFEGSEGDNSYPDEEGDRDENQTLILLQEKTILLKNWNERVRKLPTLVNRHHGCIHMNNYGHYEGNKDYPICDWCKEEEEWDVIADVKFRIFDDKFASETS